MTAKKSLPPPPKRGRPKKLELVDDDDRLENDLLSQLRSSQPLFTSTPIGQGSKKQHEGPSTIQKMNGDCSTVAVPKVQPKKRWTDNVIKSLKGALYAAGNPGKDAEQWWSKIALMVGNGFTGEDCQSKAKQVGWKPRVDENEETDQSTTTESSDEDQSIVGRMTKARKAALPGPSGQKKAPQTDSMDLDDSYFKKHFDAADDDLKLLRDDSIWATLAPSPQTRAMRRPLHVMSIVDQNSTIKTPRSDESSFF